MSAFSKEHLLTRLSTVGLVLVVMGLALLAYGTASASLDACYGDPVLHLSNGKTMVIGANIGTGVSNVKSVEYEVHAPRGVKLLSVEWSGDAALIAKEKLEFRDDAKPGQYTSVTEVETTRGKVAVTITATLDGQTKTVTGSSGRDLVVTFNAP